MDFNLYTCPTCPEDCDDFTMPAVDFSDCVDSHVEEESEISEVLMAAIQTDGSGNQSAVGAPGDWTSAASWASALSDSGGSSVRQLIGIGDKGAADQTSRVISRGRTKYGPKNFTINFDIDDVSALNYELIRNLECGVDVVVWYQTRGGYLYGGSTGVKATATADWILDRGADTYSRGAITLTWKAKCNPPRIESPIAIPD